MDSLKNGLERNEKGKQSKRDFVVVPISAFLSSSLFLFNYAIAPSSCSFRTLLGLLAAVFHRSTFRCE